MALLQQFFMMLSGGFALTAFIQLIAVSIVGFIVMKAFSRQSAPLRSLAALVVMVSLTLTLIISAVFYFYDFSWYKADAVNLSPPTSIAAIPVPKIIQVNSPVTVPAATPKINISYELISDVIGIIWLAGMAFMVLRLIYALVFLRGFQYGLSPVKNTRFGTLLKTTVGMFGQRKTPELYTSTRVKSPVTIWTSKPIVIIPKELLGKLNDNEMKSILVHELAHIYNYDHLLGLVKAIAIAVNWWNPLVYIISAEHSIAREEVSDNYVLSQLNPKVYSECLLNLAEKTCLISNLPATAGMADKHISLEQRIKNILSKKRKMEMKTRRNVKAVIFTATCSVAVFIGGVQYAVTANPPVKKKIDSRSMHKLIRRGRNLSPEEAEKLETKVTKNPDDLKAVTELLGYYSMKRFKDNNIRKKRGRIILQLIKNHPESRLLSVPSGQLTYIDDFHYAIKLWEANIARDPKNPEILWNASLNLFSVNRTLVEKYLKKGQSIEPENPKWSQRLGFTYSLTNRPQDALREYKKAYNKTKPRNVNLILPELAKAAIKSGKLEDAEKYAHEMLTQTEKTGWNHGNLIYYGNMYLGMVALKKGDTDLACKYLLAAGKTSGSPQLGSFGPNMMLAKELLAKGRKECVIEFLESCKKFWKMKQGQDKCDKWIKAIKAGTTPNFGVNLRY